MYLLHKVVVEYIEFGLVNRNIFVMECTWTREFVEVVVVAALAIGFNNIEGSFLLFVLIGGSRQGVWSFSFSF